jgi:hypothetical protein
VDVPTIAEERAELSLDSGLSYREDEPVVVRLRKRGGRYDLDDEGRAVALAGKPPGWHELAVAVVAGQFSLNVSPDGAVAVFVPAVEGGVDLAWLGGRVAEASRALYQELLDLE